MVRRWSKAEMWVPGAYLALVVAMLVYVAVGSRTGDIGFFGVWPILATAPVSLLLLSTFGPAADAMGPAPTPPVEPYYGSEPPAEPPAEFVPASDPLPADWVPDTSVAVEPSVWGGLGFSAAVLFSALVNAAAIWALLRFVGAATQRRRHAGLAPWSWPTNWPVRGQKQGAGPPSQE
ncbi:SCO4225 family membrane protein [Streptomyces sp. NPDC058874]|uniref:SCO4225 family membrane protein n=1 Tax=unclassified Streptomyces TaxID=2593676 RepID=UPI0036C5C4E8